MEIKIKNNIFNIEDGYSKVNSMPDDPEESEAYVKELTTMACFVLFFPSKTESAIQFDDTQNFINGIRSCLSDEQGIVEVDKGKTGSGKRYIYSIVKTKIQNGVQYNLNFNIETAEGVFCISGSFDEKGVTGARDDTVYKLLRKLNAVKPDMEGWFCDPYDHDFDRGFLMNVSEWREFDEMFHGHPLTELRKFVSDFIRNN